jgi:hypothetical protein
VLSLIFRLIRMPFPIVVALIVIRSNMFRRSVRWAFLNRDLATRSGREARQRADAGFEEVTVVEHQGNIV